MVFNPSILHESIDNTIIKNKTVSNLDSMIGTIGECSYFSQTVDFLIESNKEFNQATKLLYRAIYEAGDNQVIVNESFADFGTAVKKIIDKFIAFMKSLFERFITNMNSMVKSEKYLKKHKDDFKKFSAVHEFEYTGYEFTLFDSNIPEANAESEWIKDIDSADFSQYANMFKDNNGNAIDLTDITTKSSLLKSVEDKMKENYKNLTKKLEGDYYDNLRGRIIGKGDSYNISESEFAKELFCVFRNDSSDKTSITVNSSYITDCYRRFDNYEDLKKSITKTKKEIETDYKNVKSEMEKMIKTTGSGDTLSMSLGYKDTYTAQDMAANAAMLTQMELYKKAKVNQVQQMSNMHALAFATKLDAARDMFNQDKAILYKALYRIQGIKKEDDK